MAEQEVPGWAAAQDAVEVDFHGIIYTVTIQTHGEDVLFVEIEDKDRFDRWRGEFAAKYVEDITSKTGSFKKFAVFVRMLQSAVSQQSDSVYVDLLTYQDLELLKSKKAAAGSSSTSTTAAQARQVPANNKRYLILTYASEFDRVHYPLPLLHDGQPDPQRLKAVIQQLRQQLEDVTAGQQQQLALLQQQNRRPGQGSAAGPEPDAAVLASRLEVMAAQLERERAEHKRDLRRSARQLQELQDELCRSHDTARQLRLKLKTCEQELQAAKDRQQQRSAAAATAATGRPYSRRSGGGSSFDAAGWSRGASSYLAAGSSKTRQYSKYPAPSNGSSSRPGSTGGSASSSRAQSPGYTRPWVQNSTPPRPPRPSSAPPKQRFDPTQYVRQRQERQQQLAAQRSSSRGSSPARSRAALSTGGGSGASTPRAAAYGGGSTSISRQSSVERRRGSAAGAGGPEQGYLQPTLSSGSGGSTRAGRGLDDGSMRRSSSRERLGAAYGVARDAGGRGSSNSGRQRGSLQERNQARPASRDGAGAASPGRALQGVRDKLTAFMAKQQQEQQLQQPGMQRTDVPAASAVATTQQQPGTAEAGVGQLAAQGSRVFEDASSEIASIDQRLHALQDFLKKAKSSVAAS